MLKVFLLFISLISLSVNANKEKVVEELTKVFPSLMGEDVNETPFRLFRGRSGKIKRVN